jgi:hypothetical protein
MSITPQMSTSVPLSASSGDVNDALFEPKCSPAFPGSGPFVGNLEIGPEPPKSGIRKFEIAKKGSPENRFSVYGFMPTSKELKVDFCW